MPWLIILPAIVVSIGLGFLVGLRQQKTEDEKASKNANKGAKNGSKK